MINNLSWRGKENFYEKYLEREKREDKIKFYISGNDISEIFQEGIEEKKKLREYEENIPNNKQHYNKLHNIVYEMKEKQIIFVGPGGIGKTKQLIQLYEEWSITIFGSKNKAIIFSKDIEKLLSNQEFLEFISNKENYLLVDALNECGDIELKTFLKSVKCKIIATSRYQGLDRISKYYPLHLDTKISAIEFAEKLGLSKKIGVNLLSIIDNFSARECLLFLENIDNESKLDKKRKKDKKSDAPIQKLRDRYERYFIAMSKKENFKNKELWTIFKKPNGLLEQLPETFTMQEFNIVIRKLVTTEKNVFEIFLHWNVIQKSGDKFIFTNKMSKLLIKWTNYLNQKQKKDYSSQIYLEFLSVNNDLALPKKFKIIALLELIYRKYIKNGKVDVQNILNDFSDITLFLSKPNRENKIFYKKINYNKFPQFVIMEGSKCKYNLEIQEQPRYYEKNNDLEIQEIFQGTYVPTPNNFSYNSFMTHYDWLNLFGILNNFLKVEDAQNIIYKSIENNYVELSVINIIDLIYYYDLPNKFISLEEYDGFNSKKAFDLMIKYRTINSNNKELLVNYLTDGFEIITREKMKILNLYHGINELDLKKIFEKQKISFNLWYIFNNISSQKLEYPDHLKKKLGNAHFFENEFKDSISLIKKDLESLKEYQDKYIWYTRYDYILFQEASYLSNNYHSFEDFLKNNLRFNSLRRDLKWFFIYRINNLQKLKDKDDHFLHWLWVSKKTYKPCMYADNSKLSNEIDTKGLLNKLDEGIFLGNFLINNNEILFKGTNNKNSFFIYPIKKEDIKLEIDEDIKELTLQQFKNGYFCLSNKIYNYILIKKNEETYRYSTKTKCIYKHNHQSNLWEISQKEMLI